MEQAAIDLILPVLESSVVYASHYCKNSGRSTVTAKDMEYGMKHAAMTTVGKHVGTHFPEIYDEEESDEEDSVEVVDDNDEPFKRYQGTDDETCMKMNESYDLWDSWEPLTPVEIMIKNAIEQQSK
jgi:hypothetical protein